MPRKDINTVIEAHAEELMAIPGVTGVAIGATDDGEPCILVLIREDTPEIKDRIPTEVDGRPVRTYVSGVIRPMADDSADTS